MYLTLDQVLLIQDKRKVLQGDPLVYVQQHPTLGRVLTLDGTQEYGYLYTDADERLCVVPHVWDENDAFQAREALPLPSQED